MSDQSKKLQLQVEQALASNTALRIVGGNSKHFYGRDPVGETLEISGHHGVINYEPTELVITARAGTPLKEVEQTLAENNQMLAFEPPAFSNNATLGGTIACNLSGPRRPYSGAARDFVLGMHLLNGKAELLHFGGEVMKNVAGYDVSRLQCGALGSLGVILDVSLKILPKPDTELTLVRECNEPTAIETMNQLAQKPWPLSATAYDGSKLYVRLSGTEDGTQSAKKQIGGELFADGQEFWKKLKEHQLNFFDDKMPLWRLSVLQTAGPLSLNGKSFIDWGGGQRWIFTDESVEKVRSVAERAGGHAILYRGGDRDSAFHPLSPAMLLLHKKLKKAFDPKNILNPERMYKDL